MKLTAAAKVGLTVVLAALVVIAIYRGMGWRIPGLARRPLGAYELVVGFRSVKGLDPGAEVQLNGNPVGEVDKIVNDVFGGVQVTIIIRGGQPIHEHAKFMITRESIFGGYSVAIDEARSGWLTEPIADGRCSVRVERGMVKAGGLVTSKGEAIGRITEVSSYDNFTDQVIIQLAEGVSLDEDMAFVPTRPALTAPTGLAVYASLAPDTLVEGTREPGPEDLVVDIDLALQQITGQASLIIGQVSELLDELTELIDAEEVNELFDTLATEVTLIADNIERVTGRLDILLAESGPYITRTLENVEGATAEAHTLMEGLAEFNDPELRENIRVVAANLAEASESLVYVLEDLERYTGDEELRSDITGTISEARATLEQARGTLETAEVAIEEASATVEIARRIETGGIFSLRYSPDQDRWAGAVNIRVGMESSDMFLVAGIDDIGESERGNAQLGWRIGNETSARVGVHRGKLGLGLDWRSNALSFISDLYDPNDLCWDVYGGYAILPELDIMVGVEDLLEEEDVKFALAFHF